MNKSYWNEYYKKEINKEIEKNILQFYQYSLPKLPPQTEYIKQIVNITNFTTPDVSKERIPINRIENNCIQKLFAEIVKINTDQDFILSFPVIYIPKNITENLFGAYMFDTSKEEIVKIAQINLQIEKLSIFWFLDLEKSLIVLNRSAFFEGIKHTMKLKNMLSNHIETKEINIYKNSQYISKKLGINPKLALLINAEEILTTIYKK